MEALRFTGRNIPDTVSFLTGGDMKKIDEKKYRIVTAERVEDTRYMWFIGGMK